MAGAAALAAVVSLLTSLEGLPELDATTTTTAAVHVSGTLIFSKGPSRNATGDLPLKGVGIGRTPPAAEPAYRKIKAGMEP